MKFFHHAQYNRAILQIETSLENKHCLSTGVTIIICDIHIVMTNVTIYVSLLSFLDIPKTLKLAHLGINTLPIDDRICFCSEATKFPDKDTIIK